MTGILAGVFVFAWPMQRWSRTQPVDKVNVGMQMPLKLQPLQQDSLRARQARVLRKARQGGAKRKDIDLVGVSLDADSLVCSIGKSSYTLLSRVSQGLCETAARDGSDCTGSTVFSIHEPVNRQKQMAHKNDHVVELGDLSCTRFLVGARTKRRWMGPEFGQRAGNVTEAAQLAIA